MIRKQPSEASRDAKKIALFSRISVATKKRMDNDAGNFHDLR